MNHETEDSFQTSYILSEEMLRRRSPLGGLGPAGGRVRQLGGGRDVVKVLSFDGF